MQQRKNKASKETKCTKNDVRMGCGEFSMSPCGKIQYSGTPQNIWTSTYLPVPSPFCVCQAPSKGDIFISFLLSSLKLGIVVLKTYLTVV